MAEKIHPKQPIPTPNSNPNPNFPPNKSNLYNSTRPVYRPLPRRNRRSCCCSFCLCITFSLILLILIAAIAGGIFYALYRPQRPSFSVTSLQVQNFTLTNSNILTTKFNLSVTAHNPNKKIEFIYDEVNVNFRSKDVDVGHGTIPGFTMRKKDSTRLRSVVSVTGQSVGDDGSVLRSDVNKKKVPMSVRLDTKVKVKVGGLKMKKVPIRVDCSGITASVPSGKTPASASTSGVKCKVDLRIKIWKWTV
ncbi:late embryogenesis abundant (LEA) hydroxyproline-rich glycoprotein family [Artemisia annua]|uniref:Late embryogenesis abundant (LEA) hydroxyproline-rich glycoprotein family n=1 Tax=Artemisia annua TaxID=35608 RepID=A0A2U1MMJ0_ARTAN|nr:late embryogenesis abundant (LEA) hydroxyproline-rich glycoprotein family [Artemisia annua]